MYYLVDGSNLLGAMNELGSRGAEISLLARIDRFCQARRHRALVAFDGMENHEPGRKFGFGARVTVCIAPGRGGKDRADRLLLARLKERKDTQGVCLISSDRVLAALVRVTGAEVMGSREFADMLQQRLARATDDSEKEHAIRGIDNSEFRRLWGSSAPDRSRDQGVGD